MEYGTLDAAGDWRFTGIISGTYGFELQVDNIDGQFYGDLLGRTIEEFASHITIRNEQGQSVDLSVLAGSSYLSISDNRIYVTLIGNSEIRFGVGNMVTIRHDSGLLTVTAVKLS